MRIIPTANFWVESEAEKEYHDNRKAELEETARDPLVQEIRKEIEKLTCHLAKKGLLKNRRMR
ncbi:hypothetical protein KKF38_01650 [Patescibacteria group bacterium]|nr:hypothetical protein [Patescibacteria group bacterium]